MYAEREARSPISRSILTRMDREIVMDILVFHTGFILLFSQLKLIAGLRHNGQQFAQNRQSLGLPFRRRQTRGFHLSRQMKYWLGALPLCPAP